MKSRKRGIEMRKEMLILNNPDKLYKTIKTLQAKEYIDTMELNAADIEAFCRDMELDLDNKLKDEYVEKRCSPPLMIAHFYYYIYYYQKLPTQKEFKSFYARLNFQWISSKIGRKYRPALEARIDRFYASAIREMHYYHLVKDIGNVKLEYTLENDVEHKVDLVVNDAFGILLRVGTKESLDYSIEKDERMKEKKKYDFVDMPLDMRKCKRVKTKKDVFFLYSEQDVSLMEEKIKDKPQ